MDKAEGEKGPDDGIVAEDLTLLVEHIELTGAQRLPDAHEWELASPAADLDDAPILIGEVPDDDPELDDMRVEDDTQLFTETQADLNQLLTTERRRNDQAAALAAERARWQKRVQDLQRALAERDQLLAERERRIEELQAKLAARTLEREGLAAELRDSRPLIAAVTDALPPEASADDADATGELSPESDFTLELPAPELPPAEPDAAAAPRLRRYLIGLDVVGCVHEVASRRVNIGRTRDNDLRIVDPTVSRLHAMLTVRNGEAMLVDANSRNGIFVNGIQLRYARLDDGDLVTFGTVRFRYRVGSESTGGPGGSA
ncbi:MAG TPA: FHA domain-containing protein [Steroidobacteraceae bacterium]|nr:FHA domain-containing protein [Steroidobacteraceae bacterium]